MDKNKAKYPVEKSRNNAAKYTELRSEESNPDE
jgi:hypothetical protein